jgi:hypothetical protein
MPYLHLLPDPGMNYTLNRPLLDGTSPARIKEIGAVAPQINADWIYRDDARACVRAVGHRANFYRARGRGAAWPGRQFSACAQGTIQRLRARKLSAGLRAFIPMCRD